MGSLVIGDVHLLFQLLIQIAVVPPGGLNAYYNQILFRVAEGFRFKQAFHCVSSLYTHLARSKAKQTSKAALRKNPPSLPKLKGVYFL